MKIESMGVRITDTPWTIVITPNPRGIRWADQDWSREDTEKVRDALTEALRQYDAMTGQTEPIKQAQRCCDAEPGQPHTGECSADLPRPICPACGLRDCDSDAARRIVSLP